MGWWKASPEPEPPQSSSQSPTNVAPQEACPVDPKTREIWLQQAQEKQSKECSSSSISQAPSNQLPPSHIQPTRPLSHHRQVSTIPRANPQTALANSETETGHDQASGNWIYPSESQFFHAVMRKGASPDPSTLAQSVSSIIPLHNAVNERAWAQIKAWEPLPTSRCPGPKLLSFQGLGAGALSPRAKWKSWVLGYSAPFDRHDWVVERCDGQRVEYIIDFYRGSDDRNLSFHLDVRPKINSFEGCRMRFDRYWFSNN